jgi:4'-phosphopantetheinyl transferase
MKVIPVNQKSLNKNDVHIWKFDISVGDEKFSDYWELLNESDRIRASKFRFSKDRIHFLWGRIHLKRLLGAYLNEKPVSIKFMFTSNGKPILQKVEHQHIQFNMSHSGEFILFGFSRSPIGVDIEEISSKVDVNRVSCRHFSPDEKKMIETVSEKDKDNMFFEIWTKKEAVIKGIGKGLGIPLYNFSVIREANGSVRWKPEDNYSNTGWHVHTVDEIPLYKAAFATPIERVHVTYFSIN